MKFVCDTQKFSEICSNVQRSVSTKSTIPAIQGIFITTSENSVIVKGYDLEVGVVTSTEAKVEEQGSIIINARTLCDILRSLHSDTVRIEADERMSVTIRSGNAKFKIMGTDPADYPEMSDVKDSFPIVVNGEILKDMIRKTIFATAENDARIVHMGVRFEISDHLIRLIAVDGFRLAIRNENIDYAGEEKVFVVPKKALNEIMKLVDDDSSVSMNIGKKHIVFEVGNYTIVSRLLDGEFLKYQSAIALNDKTRALVNTRMLIESVERAALMIVDKAKSPIRCIFEDDTVKVLANTTIGNVEDHIAAQIDGERIEIGFNNRFLLDALKVCDTDEVKIKLGSPTQPIIIEPKDNDSFLFLILPVKLK